MRHIVSSSEKLDSTDSLARETLGSFLDSYIELGAQGTRGGVLLAWNKDLISVSNAVNRAFTISAMVQPLAFDSPFLLTTCYGPSDDNRKEEFLDELRSIKPIGQLPWIIVGQASDKNNLNLNRRLMGRFRRALDDCELMKIAL